MSGRKTRRPHGIKKSGQYKQVEVKGRRAEDANGVESRVHKSK